MSDPIRIHVAYEPPKPRVSYGMLPENDLFEAPDPPPVDDDSVQIVAAETVGLFLHLSTIDDEPRRDRCHPPQMTAAPAEHARLNMNHRVPNQPYGGLWTVSPPPGVTAAEYAGWAAVHRAMEDMWRLGRCWELTPAPGARLLVIRGPRSLAAAVARWGRTPALADFGQLLQHRLAFHPSWPYGPEGLARWLRENPAELDFEELGRDGIAAVHVPSGAPQPVAPALAIWESGATCWLTWAFAGEPEIVEPLSGPEVLKLARERRRLHTPGPAGDRIRVAALVKDFDARYEAARAAKDWQEVGRIAVEVNRLFLAGWPAQTAAAARAFGVERDAS